VTSRRLGCDRQRLYPTTTCDRARIVGASKPTFTGLRIMEYKSTGLRTTSKLMPLLEGQLRGQLLGFDFGYHIGINGFRGFLVSPRPTS
jgi:hypothetical protein